MSTGLDPSEEAAHIALEAGQKAVEVGTSVVKTGAEITGKAVVGLTYFLSKLISAEYKTKGFVPKKYFNGKPTAYFSIMQKDLVEFCRAAKLYGVAYSVILDKQNTAPNAEVDILIQDSNAALVQRIMEKYGFNMPDITLDDVAKQKDGQNIDVEKSEYYISPDKLNVDINGKEDIKVNGKVVDIMKDETFISMMEDQYVDIGQKLDDSKRPSKARTENQNIQFAHSSKTTTSKDSVKDTLKFYRQEEKKTAAKQTPQRGYEYMRTVSRKPKTKEGAER